MMKQDTKKKRIVRKFCETDAKLQLDRFFEVLRTKYNIYAFQNESPSRVDFFKNTNYSYLITTLPKRDFFIDKDTLIDEGFEAQFKNLTKEQLSDVEYELRRHFAHKFFYKIVREDNRGNPENTLVSGKLLFKNFRRKENTV